MEETLSKRLERLILNKGLNFNEFAKKIGVSHSTISRVLNGKQTPTVDTLYKASQYLNISMEELYMGEGAHQQATSMDKEILDKYALLPARDQQEINDLIDIKYQRAFPTDHLSPSTYSNGKKDIKDNIHTA